MYKRQGAVSELTANFSIGPGQGSGQTPHTVDFTDKSAGAQPIVQHAWDFGDGGTSTEVNPSHTYTTAGAYDVTLTVTDSQGNTDSLTRNDLVSVVAETNFIVPDSFRRFALVHNQPRRVLAYGTQYPDLRCVVIWHGDPFHMLNFADVDDVERNVASLGATELRWIDPSDQDEPFAPSEDPDELTEPQAIGVRPRV